MKWLCGEGSVHPGPTETVPVPEPNHKTQTQHSLEQQKVQSAVPLKGVRCISQMWVVNLQAGNVGVQNT